MERRTSKTLRIHPSGSSLLLIALTGPVGSGKTTMLRHLASWYAGRGKRVDGFVALASGREGSRGAAEYSLYMVASGEQHPFALRDDTLSPPYKFNEETLSFMRQWAGELPGKPSPALIVLDEFGPLEASGGGHMQLWPDVLAAKPDVVVVAVKYGLEERTAERLGMKFHISIDASSLDAAEELRSVCIEHEDWTRVGVFGGGAGGVEATVGSALHGAQVPLRGLILSTLQSVVMLYAADGLGKRGRVVWVPFIAAGVKALSPAGNRLRPMLAITIQGLLFAGAIGSLGWNIAGVGLGGFLVGAWAGAQGVVLQYLFIGEDLLRAYDTVIHWAASQLGTHAPGIAAVLGVWIMLWGCIAALATLAAWRRRTRVPARLRTLLDKGTSGIRFEEKPPRWHEVIIRGARDLIRPVFWAPIAIVCVIILAAGSSWENVFWIVARSATIGIVVFSVARTIRPARIAAWLEMKGYGGPALALRRAVTSKDR